MAEPSAARRLWVLLEALHGVTYFTPEARAAHEAVGLRGFWRGYFATRAAPLGVAGPAVVTAVFHGFAPTMVARALPDVWSVVSPEVALQARLAGAVAALRRHCVPLPETLDLAAAAEALRHVVATLSPAGHPLGAANAALPWPDEPLAALWQAATVLREHRGDGYVAALTIAGIGACQAHALRDAADHSRSLVQKHRGFTDEEWDDACAELRDRGLLRADGQLSPAGATMRQDLETSTDRIAAAPWRALPTTDLTRLEAQLTHLAAPLANHVIPYPNPVGAPAPPPNSAQTR